MHGVCSRFFGLLVSCFGLFPSVPEARVPASLTKRVAGTSCNLEARQRTTQMDVRWKPGSLDAITALGAPIATVAESSRNAGLGVPRPRRSGTEITKPENRSRVSRTSALGKRSDGETVAPKTHKCRGMPPPVTRKADGPATTGANAWCCAIMPNVRQNAGIDASWETPKRRGRQNTGSDHETAD